MIEAPPPYCLVDPSKMRNMDHLPRYPNISPVEIIDLNVNTSSGNEQVKNKHNDYIYLKTFIFFS